MSDVPAAPRIAYAANDAPRIAFAASDTPHAKDAEAQLAARYGAVPLAEASVIVALGGDGTMLECLHQVLAGLADGPAHAEAAPPVPVYGMNCGSVGFLMNGYNEAGLAERIERAQAAQLHPLRMHAVRDTGAVEEALALNEVALLRQLRQAAKIRITIDGQVRLAELMCDGVLVATPAGSTAYNLSAHGPIVPLSANLLPLTPISAFRPRRWRGALLPSTADVLFEVLEPGKRPVSAVADFTEVRNVVSVAVVEDRSLSVTILFDPDLGLPERIIAEQFTA